MAHDVFISHSGKDKPTADAVCAMLESRGIRCWIAPRDIIPGHEWSASIVEAIKNSSAMVLVFSGHADASPHISREVERAASRRIPIVAMRIEHVAPTKTLEYFLSTPHWLDAFTPPLERHLEQLAGVIAQILGRPLTSPLGPTATAPTLEQSPAKSGMRPYEAGAPLAGPGAREEPRNRSLKLVVISAAIVGLAGLSYYFGPYRPGKELEAARSPVPEGKRVPGEAVVAETVRAEESPKPQVAAESLPVSAFVGQLASEGGPSLVGILPGEFTMGGSGDSDEKPLHRVTITRPFYLGATDVTQALWISVMGSNPSYFKGDNLPVEQVSWDDAMAFCQKLNERERAAGRLPAGWQFTLPTEAQWEYACRAGTKGDRYSDDLDSIAWYTSNSGGHTHPVGTKQPNAWGLYDMNGNVWQWCLDWYANYSDGPVTDPTGPASGSYRVGRGGSWDVDAARCRSAYRRFYFPGFRYYNLGFRLALSSVR